MMMMGTEGKCQQKGKPTPPQKVERRLQKPSSRGRQQRHSRAIMLTEASSS